MIQNILLYFVLNNKNISAKQKKNVPKKSKIFDSFHTPQEKIAVANAAEAIISFLIKATPNKIAARICFRAAIKHT